MKTRISKTIKKRLAMLLVPFLMVGALTLAAHADNRAAKVNGQGTVDMLATADDTVYGVFAQGDLFVDNHFAIDGDVHADGSASGDATFRFGEEFSNPWGADVITLKCEIETGTVGEDGTIVLQGISFEEDFVDGVVTFEELSPFEIEIDSEGLFTLRWCKLPALDLEITKGHLKVK
jgi:hypothetical protein